MLLLYGTRPEAIKMLPIVRELRSRPSEFRPTVCVTGQHREMLDQVHDAFDIRPDRDLDLMTPGQSLNSLTARVVEAVDSVLQSLDPRWILVQGDTTSATAAALAAFHRRIAVGHVEAGLRTGDLEQPFPEEANRRIIDLISAAHFAPTSRSRQALLDEGVDPVRVHLTGNTVVDALDMLAWAEPLAVHDEVLITVHRRESFGERLEGIFHALRDLALGFPGIRWIYPVHPNPQVKEPARRLLSGLPNLVLEEPFDYPELMRRLRRCRLVLTDSGGIQEEAPTFGKPVLVLRDKTERPEGVEAGVAKLVGYDRNRIVEATSDLLTDSRAYTAMAQVANPYGDGRAAARIAAVLAGEEYESFAPSAPLEVAS